MCCRRSSCQRHISFDGEARDNHKILASTLHSYLCHIRIERSGAILDHITALLHHCKRVRADPVMRCQAAMRYGFSDTLDFEKLIINLEYMMSCIQYLVLDALVKNSMELLEADPIYFKKWAETMWSKAADWFSEWSSDRPPLNSTMPWQVKPSLVVLWGVCWMFYISKQPVNNSRNNPQQPQYLSNQNTNWIPQTTVSTSEQAMGKLISKIRNYYARC